MLVADTVLGNVEDDDDWARKYEARPQSEVERVVLDDRERRRARVRTTTDAGTDIGIVVDSDHDLSPGDVLVDDDRMVIVSFEDRDALVVSFEDTDPSTAMLVESAEFGYHVGNRHWDLAVRDAEILVALGADSERKIREITAALPSAARTRREMVDPTLFDGRPGPDAGDDTTDGHSHGPESHTHRRDGHTHGAEEHTHGLDGDAHGSEGHGHAHDHETDDAAGAADETRGSE